MDEGPFAAYCVRTGHLMMAEVAMIEIGKVDGAEGMLVRGTYNQLVVNPLMKVSAEAATSMLRIAEQFGMTPAARARIDAAKLVDTKAQDAEEASEETKEERAFAYMR